METKYIYLIIVLIVFAALALAAIRYRKGKVSLKLPGASLELGGEDDTEKPKEKVGSATTKIGGSLSGSTVITSASKGDAETDVGGDVKKSHIRTEN